MAMTYDAQWWKEVRECERRGLLRRTVKEIAENDMKLHADEAIRYVRLGNDEYACYHAWMAAACGRELLGEHEV